MKLCAFVFFIFATNVVYGQWANRVYLVNFENYFNTVVQETILELERRGYCNLKLDDVTQRINQEMYKWHVIGNVTYTNGFLVSIQKMDINNVQQSTSREPQSVSMIQGRLNIRDMKIGFDVLAELGEDGDHRFTGTFVHTLVQYRLRIMRDLNTGEMTASHTLESLSGGLDRMIYMPANNITEVISRAYTPSNIWDSVSNWAQEFILPIMLEVAGKIEYPRVCLDCR